MRALHAERPKDVLSYEVLPFGVGGVLGGHALGDEH